MTDSNETPKIHVDSDWKAQAQAEKEKLAQKVKEEEKKSAGGARGPAGQMPPASFETLVSSIATQALFALGAIPDPRTGQRFESLDLARHHIDMLTVLEEKTQGNLSDDESKLLSSTVYELRSRYIQLSGASRNA